MCDLCNCLGVPYNFIREYYPNFEYDHVIVKTNILITCIYSYIPYSLAPRLFLQFS